MPLVSSVDYVAKRIYLSNETVGIDLDTTEVYREVRALRRLEEQTPYPHLSFQPMIVAGGNVEKISGLTFTQPYVQLLFGCRIVPFDQNQILGLIRDTFTDDGLAGRDVFDRTGLSSQVEIDDKVEKVEVRTVAVGSAVTEQDKTDIINGVLAGEIDSNVVKVRGQGLTGDGSTNDPWGPA